MLAYQLIKDPVYGTIGSIKVAGENIFIPPDTDNRDCRLFLSEWEAGAQVLDENGAPYPFTPENKTALGIVEKENTP